MNSVQGAYLAGGLLAMAATWYVYFYYQYEVGGNTILKILRSGVFWIKSVPVAIAGFALGLGIVHIL